MSFVYWLNNYSKKIGLFMILLIPIVIIVLLAIIGFRPSFVEGESEFLITVILGILWIFLVLNAVFYSLNSILLVKNFNKSIRKKVEAGLPVESLEGFKAIKQSFRSTKNAGYVIAVSAIGSFILFLLGAIRIDWGTEKIERYFAILALTMVLVTIGIALIIEMPKEPAFKPGGLIGFYTPKSIPKSLDNILADSFYAFLDPATRIRYDEWTNFIGQNLKESFEPGEGAKTRMERAREKILLLSYLRRKMPKIFKHEIIKSEMLEIIPEDKYDELVQSGGGSGISQEVMLKLMKELEKQIPELFLLLDKLIVYLKDNLKDFAENNLFVQIAVPEEHKGKREPFQVLVFLFNNETEYKDERRSLKVILKADRDLIFPSTTFENISLDISEDLELKGKDSLPFYAQGEKDILELLSEILQVGDAYWLYCIPKGYGRTLISVSVEEKGTIVTGVTQKIHIKRDLVYYAKNYGSKLSFLSGAAAPLINYIRNQLGL